MASTKEDSSTISYAATKQTVSRFAALCWFILVYIVLVILWGAFVRATGSGAGCGDHWPLCNGEVLPRSPAIETIIELTHRLSTGVLGILVLWMVIWAFRITRQGGTQNLAQNPLFDPAQKRGIRRAALWTVFFILTESAIGAGIVKFEWVANNVSVERVYTIAFHLVNTFFLLAASALVAWFASGGQPFSIRPSALKHTALGANSGKLLVALGLSVLGLLLLGASGAITALGDTLYYTAGITPEESPLVARLVSMRIYHPIIAFGVLGLLWWALQMVLYPSGAQSSSQTATTQLTRQLAWAILSIYLVQLVCGAVNVYLKAPVWMQILHLLISNIIWILMVFLAASALVQVDEVAEAEVGRQVLSPTT